VPQILKYKPIGFEGLDEFLINNVKKKGMPQQDIEGDAETVSLEEMHQLEETVGWSQEDANVLQRHGKIFETEAEHMVDAWRSVIGKHPHLAKWFFGPNGKPDDEYKARVKKRFVQWVLDACFRPHDQAWLDCQEGIGLRHTPEKKNRTDDAQTPPVVPLRYCSAS
jgi:protoglobin